MEYDLIGNAMDSLNEAIDFYKSGKKYEDSSRFKYCVLLLAHSAELILKEILLNESEYLLYQNIDDIDENNPLTIGFRQSLLRVKKICKISLGKYENYLRELANLRNQIQHYRFKISEEYCDKIIIKSFSAIEYIVIEVLSKTFNDFGDYISNDQIEYLHEDKDVYNNRKQDIAKDIIDNGLNKCNIEYSTNRFIHIPCPICSEITLVNTDSKILCKFCGEKFDTIELVYKEDYNGIIRAHMLREIGRKKNYFNSVIFECENCKDEAFIFTDKWQCLVCGYRFEGTVYCDDCGEGMPDSSHNYVLAHSYYSSDNYMFLCKDCGKKLYQSEKGIEYEIR